VITAGESPVVHAAGHRSGSSCRSPWWCARSRASNRSS